MTTISKAKVKYKRGFCFYLAEDFLVQIPELPEINVLEVYKMAVTKGTLRICRGYMWDGAGKNKKLIRGFLVHEALCQLVRLGYLDYSWRMKANVVLYRLLVEDGVFIPIAWMIRKFLDFFGGVASKGGRKVQTAP